MLVLSRKVDEVLTIGPDIKIRIIRVRRDGRVVLGIEAPKEQKITWGGDAHADDDQPKPAAG